jgi:hypothetical protein
LNIPSENHPPGAAAPAGFLRAFSRWVVEHTGLVTLVTVLLVGAWCVGQWRVSFHHAQAWDGSHPGEPIPFRLFDSVGWMLTIGVGSWLWLWNFSSWENETPSTSGHADGWRFEIRKRQRIFESRPMSRRLLWIHALFGLLGFALGVAQALRLAAAAAWQEPLLARGFLLPSVLAVLVIMMMVLAVGRVRDVLFLLPCDDFVGDRAQELAQAVAEEEQAESEAEREYERKAITGWPYVVFIGGFVGGVFLANRWLPQADSNTAGQAIVSGLIGSVAALYLLKSKPRGWRVWLGVALAVAVGFLVFTHVTWHRSPLYLLLGTLWGAGVGIAATLLYLRNLRRD